MASIEEQVGYITGVVEGVRQDIRESRDEVKVCFQEIRSTFRDHAKEDHIAFAELGKRIEELRDQQNKAKYYIAGVVAATTLIVSTAAYAIKVLA